MDNKIVKSFMWKLFERFGVSGTQFVIQIILARLLDPEHYGVLSIMVIFTNLATVFIQNGFNTALIQNKDVTEEDYSSVFWVTLSIAAVLYVVLFFAAPWIADIYSMPSIVEPFRVLSLMLFPGALNSVQLAKISREMDFKKVFVSNVSAMLISGGTGIAVAFMGGGIWALVAYNMLNTFVSCIVMRFAISLKIRFKCNLSRVKVLFSFGWKLLVSSLLNTLYTELRSLVIGVKYDSNTLGYYNRGKQFPQFIVYAIDGSVQSVMLPAMSSKQDDKKTLKDLMRNSIMLSSYIVFPMMAGLAAVGTSLVSFLLTDKWLPSVPYMQIYCCTLAFYPVHSCNLQAINAVGRSDIFLKLEMLKKCCGITMLVIAVFFFDSPIAIAMTGIFGNVTGFLINAYPNKKLISYPYKEQIYDFFPSLLLSLIMFGCVLAIGQLKINTLLLLGIQIISGVIIYILLSFIFKPKPYCILITEIKKVLKK